MLYNCHQEEKEILLFGDFIKVKMGVISISEVWLGKWEWREGQVGAPDMKGRERGMGNDVYYKIYSASKTFLTCRSKPFENMLRPES